MNEVCVLLNDDIFLITVVALKKKCFFEEREKERHFTSFLSLSLSLMKKKAHRTTNKKAHTTKEDT